MVSPGKPTLTLGRVLVTDDDPQMRRVCSRALSNEGWDVTLAENGKEAILAVRDALIPFDCVVSDVNMPELDGFELIQAIRAHDEDLPVLLMTGDPTLDGAVRAIDSGAVSYLSKPFDQEMFVSSVARAARRHGVARMRRRAQSTKMTVQRDQLEKSLDSAFASVWMAFQPIVDITTKRVYAYEALIRTEEQSLKRPDVLIATAERLDRIHQLGRTVRSAVAEAMPRAPDDAFIFVNVHGLELTDEELFDPTSPLAKHAPRVVLEITERVGIDATIGASRVQMLRKQGYRIAVDDLGAGYAALGALATLEPEIVKLDMSLVRDLDRHPTKRRVVGAIATLCRELGGKVVGEGVETREELDTLAELGVELIQGYLFAKPTREFVVPTF
ncbi:MAG TPA: EAL domain-containing protein [Kofleriaceae bacterium]|jgi:EAL domain-containing protein (putative c-di-GMP-specific phosphodiesterase class I)